MVRLVIFLFLLVIGFVIGGMAADASIQANIAGAQAFGAGIGGLADNADTGIEVGGNLESAARAQAPLFHIVWRVICMMPAFMAGALLLFFGGKTKRKRDEIVTA